jgi:putative MFS transporter
MFFDGFDIYLAAGVLSALANTGFSTMAQNGWFASATLIGMTIGAFVSGMLGDRFGRRFTYQGNLAIFGLASLGAALAPNMQSLIGARFVMGIGLGAEIVVGYATFTEFIPPAVRGRWLGLLAWPVQLSAFIASAIGFTVIPNLGWRVMFLIAAAGALGTWYLRKNVPESPRWLDQRGRHAEADAVMRAIEAESGVASPPQTTRRDTPPATVPGASVFLLRPGIPTRLFVGSVTLIVLNAVIYGFLTFVPNFLVQQGVGIVRSIGFTTAMTLGSPVGGLIALLLADSLGRKKMLMLSAGLAAIVGSFYPFVGNGPMIMVVGFLLVTLIYMNSVSGFAMFVPEMFPTDIRLRCTGICNTVGRIVGSAVPVIVVSLYASHGLAGVVALMVGFLLTQVVVVGWLGVEPRRLSLEALAAPDPAAAPITSTA